MSKSRMAVGRYRVAHEFGTSTTPLNRPSIGAAPSSETVVDTFAFCALVGRFRQAETFARLTKLSVRVHRETRDDFSDQLP